MTPFHVAGLVLSVLLFAYLVAALLRPAWFE